VPKYCYWILRGKVGFEVNKSSRVHTERIGCSIVELNVRPDHVHRVSRSGGANEVMN